MTRAAAGPRGSIVTRFLECSAATLETAYDGCYHLVEQPVQRRDHQKDFERTECLALDAKRGVGHLGDRDGRKNRRLLDQGEGLVRSRGKHEPEHLREDDVPHPTAVAHARRAGGFHLAPRNGLDSGADNLGVVHAAEHAERNDSDQPRRHPDPVERQHVENQEHLNHERRVADDFDACNRRPAHGRHIGELCERECHAEGKSHQQRADRDHDGDEEPLTDFGPVVDEYVDIERHCPRHARLS